MCKTSYSACVAFAITASLMISLFVSTKSLAADPTPPGVVITSPEMNANLVGASDITINATVSASVGRIAIVEFYDDRKLIGSVEHKPYQLIYHINTPKLNYQFTARVTDIAGHASVSSAVTCVNSLSVQRKLKSYDYEEMSENTLKQIRLWIPDDFATVRGILVVTNYAGGDSRNSYQEAWYEQFMYMHHFAFLGAMGETSHVESYQVMQHALQAFKTMSHHPELTNVPYVTTGFSAGGGFASRLLVEAPDKVIGCDIISSRLNFTGMVPSAAHLSTPACIISGELEDTASVVEPVLSAYRPQHALYGWMTVQAGNHARYGQEVLAMPYLDATVRLRYPTEGDARKGPLRLKTIDPESGWIADNTSWKSGMTSITPAKQFRGDIKKSSWLPTKDIAFIYRAYSSHDRPLSIISPATSASGQRVWQSGSNITIAVDTSKLTTWMKLEFYDGATKLGEVQDGYPQFTAMSLSQGYHTFSVLGTDANGKVRTSNPVLVVVRK